MIIVKVRFKTNSQYKQKCCHCGSTLKVDLTDLRFRWIDDCHVFTCPICDTTQKLTRRNERIVTYYNNFIKEKDKEKAQ